MKKLASWSLIAVAVTPFLFSPYLLGEFTTPKAIYLRGLAFLVILLLALILIVRRKESDEAYSKIRGLVRDPIFLALSANVFLLLLSTIFAFDRTAAFFGELQRVEGFLTLFALYALYVGFWIFFEKKQWTTFFALTAASPIILCIIQFVHLGQGMTRPDALAGNPSFLAGYYLFSLFAALQTFREGTIFSRISLQYLGGLGALASLVGIMLTGTRGAILGIVLGVVCLVIALAIWGKNTAVGRLNLRHVGISAGIAMLGLALVFGLTWHAAFWQRVPGVNRVVQTGSTDANTNSRLLFAKESLVNFRSAGAERVLIGWGWDNYMFFWTKYYDPMVFYYDASVADRAHDKLIDELIMAGVLGLVSYLAVWVFFLKRIWRIVAADLVAGLPFVLLVPAYMIFLVTTFDMPLIMVYFYAVLAFTAQFYMKKHDDKR